MKKATSQTRRTEATHTAHRNAKDDVNTLLGCLEMEVKDHYSEQDASWGRVGELESLRAKLAEIFATMTGREVDAVLERLSQTHAK